MSGKYEQLSYNNARIKSLCYLECFNDESIGKQDSTDVSVKTEALIDAKCQYRDYSPKIDVTYSWDENLVGSLSGMDRMSFMKKQKCWIYY